MGWKGCLDLLALLAFFHSVISSFLTENNGGPGPSARYATDLDWKRSVLSFQFASEYQCAYGQTVMCCWHSWAMNIPSYRLVSLHVSIS